MLKLVCPYCQHSLTLPQPKAGNYAPTCKKCQTRFQLKVSSRPDGSFSAQTALRPVTEATEAPPSAATFQPETTSPIAARQAQWDETREATKVTPSSAAKTAGNQPAESPGPTAEAPNLELTQLPSSAKSKAGLTAKTQVDSPAKGSGTIVGTARGTQAEAPRGVGNVARKSALAIGSNLGPYRLLKLLGQGGMGSVYLARQTSLDRDVALKVINTSLSNSPKALARFTREAYAAAQLVHPNVVQVYDMGDDHGNCYFSMELVPGQSLADLVTNEKKLDPEQATSFILHAARGLAHAHNSGMVHRDIKPGNLLVDPTGIVKVADLGLVKVPDQDEAADAVDVAEMAALSASTDLTRFGTAIGTPYYMAPEQAKNAVTVDHRADIYSLGCTFYVLLTGKKPFDGKTFEEIVSKHTTEPLVEPSQIAARVSASLSSIVGKMMAKNPADRYQSLQELIPELERFLGITSAANFTPDEGDATTLEQNAARFTGVKLAALRGLVPLALVAAALFLVLITLFISWRWASAFLVLPLFAIAGYFVFSGFKESGELFAKGRELVFLLGPRSWLKWTLAVIVLAVAVYLVGMLAPWLFAAIVGIGLGIGYYYVFDQPIGQTRKNPLAEINQLLRKMRLRGMDESIIQSFVAKYSGKQWEELYEQLFGYEAKRRMRAELAKSEMGMSRPKFWAWRDALHDRWSSRIAALKAEQTRRHLEKIELASLKASGIASADALQQASYMAEALVDHAAEMKIATLEKRIADFDPKFERDQKRKRVKAMLAEARSGKYRKEQTFFERISRILDRFAGGYTRFLVGSLLIVGSLLWARQNGVLEAVQASAIQISQASQQTTELTPDAQPKTSSTMPPTDSPTNSSTESDADTEPDSDSAVAESASLKDAAKTQAAKLVELGKKTQPLNFPLVGGIFRNFNSLIAGLILLASAFIYGWRMSLFAFPAACVALLGDRFGFTLDFIPLIEPVSALIAVGIFAAGVVFGRAED